MNCSNFQAFTGFSSFLLVLPHPLPGVRAAHRSAAVPTGGQGSTSHAHDSMILAADDDTMKPTKKKKKRLEVNPLRRPPAEQLCCMIMLHPTASAAPGSQVPVYLGCDTRVVGRRSNNLLLPFPLGLLVSAGNFRTSRASEQHPLAGQGWPSGRFAEVKH